MNSKGLYFGALLLISMALYNVKAQGLSDSEKLEILNAHNYYRGQVDPIATNMLRMEWNEDLAYLAQYRAASCEYRREENQNQNQQYGAVGFDYVGESAAAIGMGYNSAINYTQLIAQQWFLEKRYFSYYSAACRDDDGNVEENGDFMNCGRYTQMVWARTYALGCGAFRCQELEGGEDVDENAILLVCVYGPGGNFAGEPPYTTGSTPCESCPYDRSRCVKNLCSYSGAPVVGSISVLGLLLVALGAVRSSLL